MAKFYQFTGSRSRARKDFYHGLIALGIPRFSVIADYYSATPEDRFNWFAIDLGQFLRRVEVSRPDELKSIHIPCRNVLNLGTISLLWGSLWFSKQGSLLNHVVLQSDLQFLELAQYYLWDDSKISLSKQPDLEKDIERFRRSLTDVDLGDRVHLNFLYGTALAQASIASMIARHGPIHSYRVYAVEALSEGLNLWLFSRQVRNYLEFLNFACEKEYLRLFPVRDTTLSNLPKYLRSTLVHAYRVHRYRDIRLNFVEPYMEREPTDHAYIAGLGGIRTFVIDQSDSWRISFDSHMNHEEELLENLVQKSILDAGLPEFQFLAELGLWERDEQLLELPPIDFLAQEDRLLEHPMELWSRGGEKDH